MKARVNPSVYKHVQILILLYIPIFSAIKGIYVTVSRHSAYRSYKQNSSTVPSRPCQGKNDANPIRNAEMIFKMIFLKLLT